MMASFPGCFACSLANSSRATSIRRRPPRESRLSIDPEWSTMIRNSASANRRATPTPWRCASAPRLPATMALLIAVPDQRDLEHVAPVEHALRGLLLGVLEQPPAALPEAP